uniref:(California timema) hypothetical protein n=1 Tax=Timema californicum TaxID=61474 RepID=A0A7R9J4U2_TIMCA|nr:unnamed protein product [Timema californicum]
MDPFRLMLQLLLIYKEQCVIQLFRLMCKQALSCSTELNERLFNCGPTRAEAREQDHMNCPLVPHTAQSTRACGDGRVKSHSTVFCGMWQKIDGKKEFANSQPGDVLFSPLGVKFILAFLKLGARGETSKQISKVLSLPSDKKIKESMKGLLDKFDKNFQMILNLLLLAAFTSRDFGYIDSLIQELENEYHLLILLPNKVDGLAHLEQQLIQTNLQKLRLGYKVPDLVVHIPLFSFISHNDIGKYLKARLSILFSRNNANLSGIAPNLHLDTIKEIVTIDLGPGGTRVTVTMKVRRRLAPPSSIAVVSAAESEVLTVRLALKKEYPHGHALQATGTC